ncbi:hypothetical protein LCGC14_1704960 [marine sediment metagenome]|uniref:Uncharacterized protein n=1 Tax=marine sediment metagenome TaxID=412755 RepID=A0A0F9KH04_9ZZZZ
MTTTKGTYPQEFDYVRTLPDKYWWYIREWNKVSRKWIATDVFVPYSRWNDPGWPFGEGKTKTYPAPMKHTYLPKSGNNAHIVSSSWLEYTKIINHSLGFLSLLVIDGGWINKASNKEYPTGHQIPYPPPYNPKVEGITSIENYHKVEERHNGSTRIAAFDYKQSPPDPTIVNPTTHPYLFNHFTSIDAEGNIGHAPQGYNTYIPILGKDGNAWIVDEQLEHGAIPPKEEPMEIKRAWGVDISKWNGNYNDDGIDEGFPKLSFVILKAWDGAYDRTSDTVSTFKEQYASVEPIPHKGGYGWYQTEQSPITQADLVLFIADKGLFDFMPVDYESYLNEINEKTANDLVKFVEHFRSRSPLKVPIYTNGWILTMLRAWLGTWLDTVDIWFAGGNIYNTPLISPIADTVIPDIPETFTFWQFSADKNLVADELDFSIWEDESLDVNVFNGTEEELAVYLNKHGTTPPPEEDRFSEGWNSALDNMNTHSALIRKV